MGKVNGKKMYNNPPGVPIKMDEPPPPVELLRESVRSFVKLNRRFHRDEASDNTRPVASTSTTLVSIEDISNRLKTKSSVSVAELQTLKNGLIEDPKNIEVVLNVHGSLRGLVRELTGSDVSKQCAAAGCVCNLGLGDARAGAAVAKAAGPYLCAAVDSLSTQLAVTCIWTIGNLASSGPRACSVLAAQGALTKLCGVLYSGDGELRDAAIYAVTHFAYQMKEEFSSDHLSKIVEALAKTDINLASAQLLFILSCHHGFSTQGTPEHLLQKLLVDLPISMHNHISNCTTACVDECKFLYLIRILANISVNELIYMTYIECFTPLTEGFKMLMLQENSVSHSIFWLLGNLYNFHSDHVFFHRLLE